MRYYDALRRFWGRLCGHDEVLRVDALRELMRSQGGSALYPQLPGCTPGAHRGYSMNDDAPPTCQCGRVNFGVRQKARSVEK